MRRGLLLIAYVAVFVWQPGTAFLLSPVLGFLANSWTVLPVSLVWIAAPLVDRGGDVTADDFAGEWDPTPVIVLFVIPAVTAAIGVGVALRQLVERIRRRGETGGAK